jgi:uncharacterized protein (TIGR03000 family)
MMKTRDILVPSLAVAALFSLQLTAQAGPQSGGHWPPVGSSSSYSTAPSTVFPAAPVAAAAARLQIRLPENALFWVEGKEIARPSRDYNLVSPPLDAGWNYTYHLRAQWVDHGVQFTRTRAVRVRAGDSLNVDLTTEGMDETTTMQSNRAGTR